ncbi:RNA polymerase sigma factor [Croceiramulus getboli]|nr:sigma-70 family RNA polymerase sigma factor [Flavobacteriaceae bacterium YJPT1-3]
MINGDRNLISRLKHGDRDALEELFKAHRTAFFKFASRYAVDQESLEDIYQDAVIVLFEKARAGELDGMSSAVRTYLFSVGKYMIYALSRKRKKTTLIAQDDLLSHLDHQRIQEVREPEPFSAEQKQVQFHFKKLGQKCQEILKLFYYEGYTIAEIMKIQGYDNENVVKSQKSRCLKSLKEMVTKA